MFELFDSLPFLLHSKSIMSGDLNIPEFTFDSENHIAVLRNNFLSFYDANQSNNVLNSNN